MSQENYKNKYLKYKAKYLELSKYISEINGGSRPVTIPQSIKEKIDDLVNRSSITCDEIRNLNNFPSDFDSFTTQNQLIDFTKKSTNNAIIKLITFIFKLNEGFDTSKFPKGTRREIIDEVMINYIISKFKNKLNCSQDLLLILTKALNRINTVADFAIQNAQTQFAAQPAPRSGKGRVFNSRSGSIRR
jgi:hypothetical protein